mmetsp:Transcript_14725/g.21030  ORF Transcript_14725/g.21030 Transcript_14725/m.21030 type:complete len:83 (-) Transcript_14725:560-808(-)|eukprot:CAMPEP_0184854754 /NCGR_PEP_ID=MMETSP0580-20130426/166_1 /TAXON_ID=1118495 /ORGANISM="Dactyliosolen fragilissimus" /LENGTH=82 /DNA_ID=CAMNT_0027349083 /DNA_START=37 /DNA_END=285 /DNA_ORIENTATION=+
MAKKVSKLAALRAEKQKAAQSKVSDATAKVEETAAEKLDEVKENVGSLVPELGFKEKLALILLKVKACCTGANEVPIPGSVL